MSYLRSCFAHPIHAYMDCLSVIKIVRNGWNSKSNAPEHRAYGILVQLIQRITAPYQPPIEHTEAHPEKERPATATLPGRPPIPRAQWTLQNHINVLGDSYSASTLPPFMSPMFVPHKIAASNLLNSFMSHGWAYWQYGGIPIVNPLGVSALRAERYLAKRAAVGSYYPPSYWPSSQIVKNMKSMKLVLNFVK
jgi:hypothetical protein